MYESYRLLGCEEKALVYLVYKRIVYPLKVQVGTTVLLGHFLRSGQAEPLLSGLR